MKSRTRSVLILIIATALVSFLVFFFASSHKNVQKMTFELPGQKQTILTEVTGKNIQWSRKVTPLPTHFEIEDSFYSTESDLHGVNISHSVASGLSEVFLGGQNFKTLLNNLSDKKLPIDFSDPWNPTVFVSTSSGSLGIVAEDDVFRQQVRLYYNPASSRSGLKTETLCLQPRQKYVLKWSVYPNQKRDYWAFINQVREDWGVNHLIDGAFVWFHPSDILKIPFQTLQSELKRQNVKIANMFGGWVDVDAPSKSGVPPMIGFGTATLLPEFEHLRQSISLAIQKIKAADATIKVLIYFDSQRDSSPNTLIDYKDSLFANSDRSIEYTDWMKSYSRTWSVYPTQNNSFGKKLLDVITAVKRLGADGIYWDEMESLDYSGVRFTHNAWDGYSCTFDRNQKVISKIAYLNLLSDDVKLSYAEAAGLVMANSPPTTRRFQVRPDLHMVEGQHLSDWSAYIHLSTPIAFIGSDDSWKKIISPIQKGLVPASVRLGYATSFFAKLFPITPIKIFPGVIYGRERIVATQSGTYAWLTHCSDVQATQYGSNGKETDFHGTIVRVQGVCRITVKLSKDEAVILKRIPSVPEDASETPAFADPIFL